MTSRLIIALDSLRGDLERIRDLTQKLCGIAAGFKVGWPNIVWGGRGVVEAVHNSCMDALKIVDLKLADIAYVMEETLIPLLRWADAVIAHAFIGSQGALEELKRWLEARDRKLILVSSMSHPGSREVMDPCLERILGVVERIEPWGVVAPATRPKIIRTVRERLGASITIVSPGVGAQGARPGDALRAGADYEIVGRMITTAPNPLEAARRIVKIQEEALVGGSPR